MLIVRVSNSVAVKEHCSRVVEEYIERKDKRRNNEAAAGL